jgi:hypothetical protein
MPRTWSEKPDRELASRERPNKNITLDQAANAYTNRENSVLLDVICRLKKTDHNPLSDTELLALYRETRNKEHVGVLYKRYSHLVFGCA